MPATSSPYPLRTSPPESVALAPLSAAPLVSIIVPSFNQGRFLRATIDSILAQDYRPLKIHVVDGASRDESIDVLLSYGSIPELVWVSERDSGVVEAVNKGFAQAEGEILGIQSSDDTYLPGAIGQAVRQLQAAPAVGLVYGDTVKIDADGNELQRSPVGPFSVEKFLLLKTWIPQPSAFFRRQMLEVVGGWDERVPYAADTDLWFRLMFRTHVLKVDEFWSQRRIHDAQRDTQVAKIVRDYTGMLSQSPDLATAAPEIQRAAKASAHLFQVRYNPGNSQWRAAWHVYQAGRYVPAVRNWTQIFNHLFHWPARNFYRRLRGR